MAEVLNNDDCVIGLPQIMCPSCGHALELSGKPLKTRPADPDPIIDVNTPEAAAEFKRLRDAGVFGCRNEAEYQARLFVLRIYDLFEDEMTYVEFVERLKSAIGVLWGER